MCGIVGFNWEDKSLLRRMADTITYRGPDDSAFFTDSGISLGMRRLSIIDLKKDLYPLTNETKDVFLVFNGEIYNFKKLRSNLKQKGHKFKTDSDGEVMIHLYEEYGINFLNHLNGMFAICIYDAKKKEFLIARDRVGIKPLYYYFSKGNFVFASEIKSILSLNSIKREVNLKALNHYLALRYNPLEETMFKGIKKLLPGHYISFDLKDKTMSVMEYWNYSLKQTKKAKKSKKYYEKEILALLKDSIKKRLISDVPLGVFLSGGIDSSAIVALMSEIKQEMKKETGDNSPIKTYSVGFEKGEKVNETKYAKQVSELFGTEHKEFILSPDIIKLLPKIVEHTDEPMADPALIPLYLLAEEAKKTSTVVLTGDGGDELFAGYDHHRFLKAVSKADKVPLFRKFGPVITKMIPLSLWNKFHKYSSDLGKDAYRRGSMVIKAMKHNKAKAYYDLMGVFDDEQRKELLRKDYYQPIDYKEINEKFFQGKKEGKKNKSSDYLNQVLSFDTKTLLAEQFLMKTDRMTMAQSIEARVPFLDHRLVELAFQIPSKYKLKGLSDTKHILKKSLEKQKKLPKNILYRKKQGFHMPIENWLNNELKSVVDKYLNITKIHRQGIINAEYVKKIRQDYDKGKLFYANQIWTLLTFQIWYEKFIARGEGTNE